MPAVTTKEVKIRIDLVDMFGRLKGVFGVEFGTKTAAEVTFVGLDPADPSKMLWEFQEEPER